MSKEGAPSMNTGEQQTSSREQEPSSSSVLFANHEAIITALRWVYSTPTFYRKGLSEVVNGSRSRRSREFDDSAGEYVPSREFREEAAQDIWEYALNKAGVSLEDIYTLAEEAGERNWQEREEIELRFEGDKS